MKKFFCLFFVFVLLVSSFSVFALFSDDVPDYDFVIPYELIADKNYIISPNSTGTAFILFTWPIDEYRRLLVPSSGHDPVLVPYSVPINSSVDDIKAGFVDDCYNSVYTFSVGNTSWVSKNGWTSLGASLSSLNYFSSQNVFWKPLNADEFLFFKKNPLIYESLNFDEAVINRLTLISNELNYIKLFIIAIFAIFIIRFLWWLFNNVFFGGV